MEEKEIERDFFMSYVNDQWVMNMTDPVTKEVVKKKVFANGGWRDYIERKPASTTKVDYQARFQRKPYRGMR
jgi:hypothetical protein